MPEFKTYLVDGKNVSEATLAGRPAVIAFFDTKCPDCRAELPEIEFLYRRLGEHISFLAVTRDEGAPEVMAFWDQNDYTMPLSAEGNRTVYNLFDRGSGSGVPQVYVFDEGGVLIRFFNDKSLLYADEFLTDIVPLVLPDLAEL